MDHLVVTTESLSDLIDAAAEASPGSRIEYRDPIAACGEAAIDPMTDWLGDHRLAAFAIRVLERVGRDPSSRPSVVAALRAVDRRELPPQLAGDVDWALSALGAPKRAPRSPSRNSGGVGGGRVGSPGVGGRSYWVMRTSQWERPFVWAEAQAGRLRQGWGSTPEQDLVVIADVRRRGGRLNNDQEYSVRSRRMNTAEPDGMRDGDLIVAPNLPIWGHLSVFRVVGSYRYEMVEPHRWGERFGHVLPVELLAADVDREARDVSDGLRAMLRPQSRLYNITGYGGDVERLLGNAGSTGSASGDRWGQLWTEREYETLFGRFPPNRDRPSDDEVAALAAEFGRTPDAISWQWDDGASYCSGGIGSTTSDSLKTWLDRSGACDPA
jgi:hypothetical protein